MRRFIKIVSERKVPLGRGNMHNDALRDFAVTILEAVDVRGETLTLSPCIEEDTQPEGQAAG